MSETLKGEMQKYSTDCLAILHIRELIEMCDEASNLFTFLKIFMILLFFIVLFDFIVLLRY